MTVPTCPEPSSSEGEGLAEEPVIRSPRVPLLRRRGVLPSALGGLALAVLLLVIFVPELAAPLGTAAAVVAVAVTLINRDTRPPTHKGPKGDT